MMTAPLYFNTVNQAKVEEIAEIFNGAKSPIRFLRHSITEINSVDLEEVVRAKALAAYRYARVPVVVEHGALFIDYLKGFPGPLSKPMWDLLGADICGLIPAGQPRSASAGSAVCYCDGKRRHVFVERVRGEISERSRGSGGFQWDPIFVPEGQSKTLAEMDRAEKLTFSQAARAYKQFRLTFGI